MAVLDTNVWLDLLVFRDPACAAIGAALACARLVAPIDAYALEELSRVLAYPLGRWSLDATARERALGECASLAREFVRDLTGAAVAGAPLPRCRDERDQPFLELARDSGAHWLITKDRDLLTLARRRTPATGFAILTPAAACERLAGA